MIRAHRGAAFALGVLLLQGCAGDPPTPAAAPGPQPGAATERPAVQVSGATAAPIASPEPSPGTVVTNPTPAQAAEIAARLGRVPGPGEAAVLAAAGPALAGARRLSGGEVRRLVYGNTLARRADSGVLTLIHVSRDGQQRLRITTPAGQSGSDRGSITLDGDRVCARWERIGEGRPLCFAYFLRDGAIVMVDLAGQMTPSRFELRPGDQLP